MSPMRSTAIHKGPHISVPNSAAKEKTMLEMSMRTLRDDPRFLKDKISILKLKENMDPEVQ